MMTPTHEEADTIPLQVLDVVQELKSCTTDVWPRDTDILILLIDLMAVTTLVLHPAFVRLEREETSEKKK